MGYYAYGGGNIGLHTYNGLAQDPIAWDFFEPWTSSLLKWVVLDGMWVVAFITLIVPIALLLGLRRMGHTLPRKVVITQVGGAVIAAACFVLPVIIQSQISSHFSKDTDFLPSLFLISGQVTDATTGAPLSGARVVQSETGIGMATTTQGRYELVTRSASGDLLVSANGFQTNRVFLNTNLFGRKRHAQVDPRLQKRDF